MTVRTRNFCRALTNAVRVKQQRPLAKRGLYDLEHEFGLNARLPLTLRG